MRKYRTAPLSEQAVLNCRFFMENSHCALCRTCHSFKTTAAPSDSIVFMFELLGKAELNLGNVLFHLEANITLECISSSFSANSA